MSSLAMPKILLALSAWMLVPTAAVASADAFKDCIVFYGLPEGHSKRQEVERTCREVTKTMAEWKGLKRALCGTTPQDPKCKEFRGK